MIWLYYAVIKDVRYTFRSFNTVNITENYISPVCSFPSVGLWCPITWSVLKTKVLNYVMSIYSLFRIPNTTWNPFIFSIYEDYQEISTSTFYKYTEIIWHTIESTDFTYLFHLFCICLQTKKREDLLKTP